jgi:hypothetical protein
MITNIHAIEMVRQIRDENYGQTCHMTTSERILYYHNRAKLFHARLAKQYPNLALQKVLINEDKNQLAKASVAQLPIEATSAN